MREFWVSSGHHLTRRAEGGGLLVTDELLLAYLARPELMPPEEACEIERALPCRPPGRSAPPCRPDEIARWWTSMRARTGRSSWPSATGCSRPRPWKAAYLDLVRRGAGTTPPLLLDQLVHLILRNALEGCADPYVLRAAELFFRPQRVSVEAGATLLADAEIVEQQEAAGRASPLLVMMEKAREIELDVMTPETSWTYWSRSDAFTMALNIGGDARARDGLARAIEAWLRHLLHLETRVEPIPTMEDPDWRWFVGLDAEGTRIGNALWAGDAVADAVRSRVLALFRLTIGDETRVDPHAAGYPVYLILAMTQDRTLRLKPQNLLVGLPLGAAARAA
jgi:hypothetical protein